MILQGVLDRSLGNFFCLRGYAPLGELFKISEPEPSYQHDLIASHQEEMEQFLDDAEFLFFPEVIMGASLGSEDNSFISEFYNEAGSRHKFPQFNINYSVTTRQVNDFSRNNILFRRATLTLKDDFIETSEFNKFHRIDGNHRLSVLNDNDLSTDKLQRFGKLNVPFCIVLFTDDEYLERFSPALFHNINYRQIPLTMFNAN